FVGPAKRGEGPQAGGEPCIQHIIILAKLLRAARLAAAWVFARRGHMTSGAVPDGNAVPPPELAADAPVFDVLEPVEVHLLKPFGHDLDTSVSDGPECGLCQGLDAH